MAELPKNTFFDINQFPQDEGMLVFGISMNRIENSQSAGKYFEYLEQLDMKIKKTKGMGAMFLYGDYLYFLSSDPAKALRTRFIDLMTKHKNGFLKIIRKHLEWIPKSFSFTTYGQLLLDNSEIFAEAYRNILDIYNQDKLFQKYVLSDCKDACKGKEVEQQLFILEEITLFYLASKGKLTLHNEFINGHEKWILNCYPGKPLRAETYLYQLNPLGLQNKDNKYENNYYDLAEKRLYDFNRIDLETFDFNDERA